MPTLDIKPAPPDCVEDGNVQMPADELVVERIAAHFVGWLQRGGHQD
jgi:hypothetical protein